MSDVIEVGAFEPFRKIARLNRECVISEKIDGTNAQLLIEDLNGSPTMKAGSRTQWLSKERDNAGFWVWAMQHHDELIKGLGYGRHYGEWWGGKVQRGYGLKEKKFSLFNTERWNAENLPSCCSVVPRLYRGPFTTEACVDAVESLRANGSFAAPGFMKPEGIVVYHVAAGQYFKVTLEDDDKRKGEV